MLKGIVFFLSPMLAESQDLQKLLGELELCGINYVLSAEFSSHLALSAIRTSLALPPENCLILTDSAEGISFARKANIPCVGYAPPENREDMFGAYALFEDFASIDAAYLCRTHAHRIGYPAEILSTKRLTVREFSDTDFPVLYTMCTDPSAACFMEEVLSDYETEQEKHCAYIRNIYPIFDLALWGVYEKDSGKLVGRAGFSLPENNDHTFSLGYLIDVPYRRQGFAKELLPALLSYAGEQGYTEITARIIVGNTGSVKALEQCGFPYECRKDASLGILTYLIHLTE